VRLAWFTPWPPQPSGIAGRSAELVPMLARRGPGIDVFVDDGLVPGVRRAAAGPAAPGEVRVQSAHDFVWRHARRQFDLAVYQLGNSACHQFIWPYAFRWPGLVALHDARLHHARGKALLRSRRSAAYRDEFTWNHPAVDRGAAELAIAGFDGVYYYQWPMTRAVVASARLVAVHARGAADALRAEYPDRPIVHVTLGEGDSRRPTAAERAETRARFGWGADQVVFGVFGALTAEKRIAAIMRAFAATRHRAPRARLLLAGSANPLFDPMAEARAAGIADAVDLATSLDTPAFDRAIAAVDVGLHLRWPTALETSGPWLRALAAARPTIVMDLAHLAHVPSLDPRTWRRHGPADPTDPSPDLAATIAIDVLDEDHSLRLAMQRLAVDSALRDRVGLAGRAYWESTHTVGAMADDYERAMSRAAAEPPGPARPGLPVALRPDALAHTQALLAPFGVDAMLARWRAD
jgi:glycosyltransferase involved in cell wall biosynthesis